MERKGQKLEFSGSVPFNSVVLPLAAALDHYKNTWSGIGEQKVYYPSITLCISVVDAPMIVARGTPEEPKLTNEPWVRVVRQEAVKDGKWWRGQHYVIDIVQRVFFASYIADHAVPAAEQLASRMKEREDVVVAAKGTVADNEWSWPNVHPVSSRARGG